MTRFAFELASWAPSLALAATMACATAPASTPISVAAPMVAPMVSAASAMSDADATVAFRALIEELIGDSADKVCLSIAINGSDADPSAGVMHALARHASTHALTHSECATDERNFGNPHALLRLRDASHVDEHTLMVQAEAIGDHSARYECLIPLDMHGQHTRCRITARDWPGSQKRD
jgi:hypothetical protein